MDVLNLAGTVTFMLFIVSPGLAFLQIIRAGAVKGFTAYPYVALLLKCVVGIIYSLEAVTGTGHSNHFDAYLMGLIVEPLFVMLLIKYTASKERRAWFVCFFLTGFLIISAALLGVMLLHPPVDVRRKIIGGVFTAFTILTYISPFAVCKRVHDTRKVQFMPLLPILAVMTNSAIFIVISLREKDIFVLISSIVGLVSGTIQLLFFGSYFAIEMADTQRHLNQLLQPPPRVNA